MMISIDLPNTPIVLAFDLTTAEPDALAVDALLRLGD